MCIWKRRQQASVFFLRKCEASPWTVCSGYTWGQQCEAHHICPDFSECLSSLLPPAISSPAPFGLPMLWALSSFSTLGDKPSGGIIFSFKLESLCFPSHSISVFRPYLFPGRKKLDPHNFAELNWRIFLGISRHVGTGNAGGVGALQPLCISHSQAVNNPETFAEWDPFSRHHQKAGVGWGTKWLLKLDCVLTFCEV